MELEEFVQKLASKEPVPGGGGASALMGTLSAALLKMVAELTTGKKKYAAHQEEIDAILLRLDSEINKIYAYIEKDAESFAPLAKAYALPKETEGRAEIFAGALVQAARTPLELMGWLESIVSIIETLAQKGSRLAVSDVGVAAVACKSAVEAAAMNVYINTKLMKNRVVAESMNKEADCLLASVQKRCESVYKQIQSELRGID